MVCFRLLFTDRKHCLVDVTKYLERADTEVKRKNFDGAMALYAEILRLDPDAGEARRGLRRAALKKHEKSYPGALSRAMTNLVPSVGIAFASMFKANQSIVNLAESALKNDPKNLKFNLRLGHALLRLGHKKSAEAAFHVVTEINDHDVESLKVLGQLYYDARRHDEALKCYERALKINPRDQEAGKMRKNLAAEGAIQTGGFQTAKSARDLAKSEKDLSAGERDQRIVKTGAELDALVQELEAEVEKNPANLDATLRLVKSESQRHAYDKAVDLLVAASRRFPENAEITDLLGETRVTRLERRLEEARKASQPADAIDRLEKELLALQTEEARRRVTAHPTDLPARFRLGRFLLQAEEVDPAIEQLQQAVKDPRHRVACLHLLGRAFAKKGILDLAAKEFQEAADAIHGMGEQKKQILYDLGLVNERQGRKEQALDVYKRIFENDIGFKDVGKKIDALKTQG
jgi:tetratricopeptide (TPR) repeat protein